MKKIGFDSPRVHRVFFEILVNCLSDGNGSHTGLRNQVLQVRLLPRVLSYASLTQLAECCSYMAEVIGSSPIGSTYVFLV